MCLLGSLQNLWLPSTVQKNDAEGVELGTWVFVSMWLGEELAPWTG